MPRPELTDRHRVTLDDVSHHPRRSRLPRSRADLAHISRLAVGSGLNYDLKTHAGSSRLDTESDTSGRKPASAYGLLCSPGLPRNHMSTSSCGPTTCFSVAIAPRKTLAHDRDPNQRAGDAASTPLRIDIFSNCLPLHLRPEAPPATTEQKLEPRPVVFAAILEDRESSGVLLRPILGRAPWDPSGTPCSRLPKRKKEATLAQA